MATDTWNGSTADWYTSADWSSGIPTNASDVVINVGEPELLSGDAGFTVASITIGGGELLVNDPFQTQSVLGDVGIASGSAEVDAGSLTIGGNTTVSGVLNLLNAYTQSTGLQNNSTSFSTSGNLSITSSGVVNVGTGFNLGSASLTIGGNLSNAGSLNISGINSPGSSPVKVDGEIFNTGTIVIQTHGGVRGSLTSAGTVTTSGTLIVGTAIGESDGGEPSLAAPTVNVTGGTLEGHGSVTGTVNNTGGTVMAYPGIFFGLATSLGVGGNYNQSSSGTFETDVVEALGSGPLGDATWLSVGGSVNLSGGTLVINAHISLALDQLYTVMTFTPGSLSGEFSQVQTEGLLGNYTGNATSVNLGNGNILEVLYNNAAGTIQIEEVPLSWASPVSGNWNTASNWSPATVPVATSQVEIGASGTYTVTVNSSDVAQGLTVNDAGATVSDNRGGTLTLAGTGGTASPNGALTIASGTFDLNGGALKAGSISTGSGGTLLIGGGVSYTGANSLGETITDNGAVTVQGLAAADFTADVDGGGSITVQNLAKADFSEINVSSMTLQNGAAATIGDAYGYGTIKVQNLGLLTITGGVSEAISVSLTSGALAVIKSAVTDYSGSFSLANASALEFGATTYANVTFGSGANILKLDDSKQFTGTLSGLTKSDVIDLGDLSYVKGKTTATYSGTTSGGTLTVSNGTTSVELALAGNYTTSTWTLSSDGKGGTNVVDPPSSASGSNSSADIAQTDANTGADVSGLAVGANATLGFQQGSQNAGALPAASQSVHAAHALLNQYAASSFALGGVDHGGAVVGPLPVAAPPLLASPHHA